MINAKEIQVRTQNFYNQVKAERVARSNRWLVETAEPTIIREADRGYQKVIIKADKNMDIDYAIATLKALGFTASHGRDFGNIIVKW
jgi:hypothetical protein